MGMSLLAQLGPLDPIIDLVTEPLDWVAGLNPFVWFNEQLRNLMGQIAVELERMLGNPTRLSENPMFNDLNNQTVVLAGYLLVTMASVLGVWVAWSHKKLGNLLHALVLLAVLGTAGAPLWFFFNDLLSFVGDGLTDMASFYKPAPGKEVGGIFGLPAFNNILGSIGALSTLGIFAAVLTWVFYIYEFLNILFNFLGPIALAMSVLGKRSQAFWNWLLAVGLTVKLFGRPLANLAINFGELASDKFFAGETWFGKAFWLITAVGLAIYLQKVAYDAAKARVDTSVVGQLHARVTGSVDSMVKGDVKGGQKSVQHIHANTMPGASAEGRQTALERAQKAWRTETTRQRADAMGIAAGPSRHLGTAMLLEAVKRSHPGVAAVAVGSAAVKKSAKKREAG